MRIGQPMIRRAVAEDAEAIVAVLNVVVTERVHSAIDQVWSVEVEQRYLAALSSREAVHVAVDDTGRVVGLQTLDRWSSFLTSMAHVGQVGTFLLPEWRGQGMGRRLWTTTVEFAREVEFRKLVVYIRASNAHAQAFYRGLGFRLCGRLAQQVIIDGVEEDEVLMELFL